MPLVAYPEWMGDKMEPTKTKIINLLEVYGKEIPRAILKRMTKSVLFEQAMNALLVEEKIEIRRNQVSKKAKAQEKITFGDEPKEFKIVNNVKQINITLLEKHPDNATILPPPTHDERERLKKKIQNNPEPQPFVVLRKCEGCKGVCSDCVGSEEFRFYGKEYIILDGNNRFEIMNEDLGYVGDVPCIVLGAVMDYTKEEQRTYMENCSLGRRNLTKEQKAEIAKHRIARGIPQSEVAELLGIDQATVSRATKDVKEVRKEAESEAIEILSSETNMSQQEIAETVGVNQGTVSRIMQNMQMHNLHKNVVSEKTNDVKEVRKEAEKEAINALADAGKTQSDISKGIGVNQGTVSRIMQNTRNGKMHKNCEKDEKAKDSTKSNKQAAETKAPQATKREVFSCYICARTFTGPFDGENTGCSNGKYFCSSECLQEIATKHAKKILSEDAILARAEAKKKEAPPVVTPPSHSSGKSSSAAGKKEIENLKAINKSDQEELRRLSREMSDMREENEALKKAQQGMESTEKQNPSKAYLSLQVLLNNATEMIKTLESENEALKKAPQAQEKQAIAFEPQAVESTEVSALKELLAKKDKELAEKDKKIAYLEKQWERGKPAVMLPDNIQLTQEKLELQGKVKALEAQLAQKADTRKMNREAWEQENERMKAQIKEKDEMMASYRHEVENQLVTLYHEREKIDMLYKRLDEYERESLAASGIIPVELEEQDDAR